jgi:hypothetical protein
LLDGCQRDHASVTARLMIDSGKRSGRCPRFAAGVRPGAAITFEFTE